MLDAEFFEDEDDFYVDRCFTGETANYGGFVSYSGYTYITGCDPVSSSKKLVIYKRLTNGWLKIKNNIKRMFNMKMDKTKNKTFQSWDKPSDIPNYFRIDKNRTLKKPESPQIHAITRDKK